MPLHDHFRSPLDDLRHWESFLATWPAMMVANLQPKLPDRYFPELQARWGRSVEIDVATYENESENADTHEATNGSGGVATAVWAPPKPAVSVATDLPSRDVYEVSIYDKHQQRRLVAAVEIVSPANKDRPEHRNAFVAKCAALLQQRVSVVIVDIVTTRTQSLYSELLDFLGLEDPNAPSGALYVSASRTTKADDQWLLQNWREPLALKRALPTMPLWLADNLAVPLDLEATYEQSCEILSIPRTPIES